jgi:hypothetical protein
MRQTSSPARAARRLAPVAAAVVALGLTGCQLTNPVQTNDPYVPSDGVPVDLDQVQIRDLVVVAESKGGPGTLSGAVVNRSGEPVTITFAGEGGASTTVQVPANGQERLSGTSPVSLAAVNADPGGVATLQISTAAAGSNVVHVPVLPPEGYYETLAPSAPSTP